MENTEKLEIGTKVLKVIQTRLTTRFNATSDSLKILAYDCTEIESNYDVIADKIKILKYSMDLRSALKEFIARKGEVDTSEPKKVVTPVAEPQPELPVSQPATQNLGIDVVGLLTKTLADVIVKDKGEMIRNSIIENVGDKVEEYIKENYGAIQRKVEITVKTPQKTTQFGEVLHSEFETVMKLIAKGKAPYLVGEAGTGKNVICEQVAKALGLEFYFSNAVTQEYKLTGFTDANGTYHETQFYKAFKNGGVFMLDEMDASIPEALLILNMALANKKFDFPAPIGRVDAHPDFHVVSAGNTFGLGADYKYSGRNQLDMASLDRFIPVEIDYDKNIELAVAQGDTELVEFAEEFREHIRTSESTLLMTYRAIKNIADLKDDFPLPKVMQMCAVKNMREDDVKSLIYGMNKSNKYVKAIYDLYD